MRSLRSAVTPIIAAIGLLVATSKTLHAQTPGLLVATSTTLVAQATYSHGDPTPEEQYLLELLNRARANPAAEGQRLVSLIDPTRNPSQEDPNLLNIVRYYGVDRNKV